MMNRFLLITGAVLLTASLIETQTNSPVFSDFGSFKRFHRKNYASPNHESRAIKAFQTNSVTVRYHNMAYWFGQTSFMMELNQFADILPQEFNKRNGYKEGNRTVRDTQTFTANSKLRATLPATFDWRNQNKVSPVLDQGQCGSCYAFAAVQTMESQVLLQNRPLLQFSEQQIVDCSTNNYGCSGGIYQYAWSYIQNNKGIDSASSYPYVSGPNGVATTCKFKAASVTATVSGYTNVATDYTSIMTALVNKGPLAIAIDASQGLQMYQNAIYACTSKPAVDHAVVLVGYSQTSSGQQYWIVKNSWGTSFGINGYFYLARGAGDCGLTTNVAYPTVTVSTTSG